MKKNVLKNGEKLVEKYFEQIQSLRDGNENSVDELMKLWNTDGVFEFSGSAPLIGTYKGELAIRTLYNNRLKSNGMELKLHAGRKDFKSFNLGIVKTDISHVKTNDDKIIVGWKTTIGTKDGLGYDISGSHLFLVVNEKIKSLRVTISTKPEVSSLKELSMEELSIQDIGRLSLAAWPVV